MNAEHRCTGSVTGKHDFDEHQMCRYCAVPLDEIRHLLPKPQHDGSEHYYAENFGMSVGETSDQAIRDFFKGREG